MVTLSIPVNGYHNLRGYLCIKLIHDFLLLAQAEDQVPTKQTNTNTISELMTHHFVLAVNFKPKYSLTPPLLVTIPLT